MQSSAAGLLADPSKSQKKIKTQLLLVTAQRSGTHYLLISEKQLAKCFKQKAKNSPFYFTIYQAVTFRYTLLHTALYLLFFSILFFYYYCFQI